MSSTKRTLLILAASLLALLALSCAKHAKEEKKTEAAPVDTSKAKELSYISEEINFGAYFDEAGTKRTIKLEKDQKELTVHLIVRFPEGMKISAVEYRLVLPQGLKIESEKVNSTITAHLGSYEEGMSETFPCVSGPKLLLHTLTLQVTGELKNAEIAMMPDPHANFIGVSVCKEGFPMINGSSYKAVVNPTE